jgi:hypothetical protein
MIPYESYLGLRIAKYSVEYAYWDIHIQFDIEFEVLFSVPSDCRSRLSILNLEGFIYSTSRRHYFRGNRILFSLAVLRGDGILHDYPGFLRFPLLIFVIIKYRGSILRPTISSLLELRRRVVVAPEDLEE